MYNLNKKKSKSGEIKAAQAVAKIGKVSAANVLKHEQNQAVYNALVFIISKKRCWECRELRIQCASVLSNWTFFIRLTTAIIKKVRHVYTESVF